MSPIWGNIISGIFGKRGQHHSGKGQTLTSSKVPETSPFRRLAEKMIS